MSVLIKGDTVCTAEDTFAADMLCSDVKLGAICKLDAPNAHTRVER